MKELSIAGNTRKDILDAELSTGKVGAHIAPSLSLVEICLAILSEAKEEDSIVLSKGHGALGLYAAMHQMGIISDQQFGSFEENGGDFPGQPSRNERNHIEYSSGSLGMGLPYATGVACAKREQRFKVYVILGDGELNEGSIWEAASLASQLKLGNLIAIVDNNGLQSDGQCKNIVDMNLKGIWESFGWNVVECDGNSIEEVTNSIKKTKQDIPTVVLAKTVKGKGISFMENNNEWHHHTLNEKEYAQALEEIEAQYGLH